jgi:hypothetical protein
MSICLEIGTHVHTSRLIAELGREEFLATDDDVKERIAKAIEALGCFLKCGSRRSLDTAYRAITRLPINIQLRVPRDCREFNACLDMQ